MEDAQTLSTDVLSEKEAADAILKEKQLRNHKNRVVFRYLFNEQRYVFETVLVGAGIAVSVGSLYGHYYRANPAERIHLQRSHPQLAHYLSKLSIIPPESAEEVPSSQCSLSLSQYANYDYSLFATRLAAAILSDPSHRIASMRSLLDVLDEVFFFIPPSTQWIDLSALPVDASLPLTQSNVVSLFQSLRPLPHFYALYLFVAPPRGNEQ